MEVDEVLGSAAELPTEDEVGEEVVAELDGEGGNNQTSHVPASRSRQNYPINLKF